MDCDPPEPVVGAPAAAAAGTSVNATTANVNINTIDKYFAAALRFARDFRLAEEHPVRELLRKMLDCKHYESALKHANVRDASVDGEHSPLTVLHRMIAGGQSAVALKYVHKFKLAEQVPPAPLVRACLDEPGELCVRTCGLLLKYVKVFQLEESFPMDELLARVKASGVVVHEMDGNFVCKGRRRQVAQPGGSLSTGASPQPGTSPVAAGSAPA